MKYEFKTYQNHLNGKLLVWKKAKRRRGDGEALILLEISARTRRIGNPNMNMRDDHYRKCRAARAKVLGIWGLTYHCSRNYSINEKRQLKVAYSGYDRKFKYRVGETVKPTKKFDTRDVICGSGIHFFVDIYDAKNYYLL